MSRWRAVMGAVALCAGCAHRPPVLVETTHVQVDDLAFKRFGDERVWRLSDDRGHVVLLDFWATWCDPCRDSLPLYDDLQKEFARRGLRVYAVSVDADPRVIAPFVSEMKLSVPVLRDPEAVVAESKLKVKMMPTAFLIDRHGVIRHVHEGFDESMLQTWLDELNALLAEPE